MSETNSTTKPDPTFLKDENIDLRKPLGLVIEERRQTLENDTRGTRLSRRELEALLDGYYANQTSDRPEAGDHHHAQIAGGRMVRNLAFASSLALFLGFGLGLYGLSHQGGETQLGQKFNQALASLRHVVLPENIDKQDHKAFAKTAAGKIVKPVKTASLVVADASGTIDAGIPLKLALKSGTDAALLEVKISNVPGDAVLTAGTRRPDGVWVLQPGDLANVALVLSSSRNAPLHLGVELVEIKTGELLSPTREIKVAILQPESFTIGGL